MINQQGHILVVEDVPNILELLEVTLRFKGYQVVTARNGQEALEKIKQERPALIITDILMPTMDGYAFVHKLRSDPANLDIPVIFLSATYVTPEDKAFAMSLGATQFIEKPIDTEDFLLTIAELLMQKRPTSPIPLDNESFYSGYRARLENKLRHKNNQAARAERILKTLPVNQVTAYESLLQQTLQDRAEIEKELQEVYRVIDGLRK
ncbi:MAG: response regulator [Anaerolineales bacterium]|nr:response regulator [Anaerolineales bacterium]